MTSIANSSLSINAMQMWLRFDKNRSKKMDHNEIKEMVEIVMGSPPTYEFMEELYTEWNLPSRQIDFKTWNQLVPMKSNELQLRQRFRAIEANMYTSNQNKPKKEDEDRNAWAKDLLKNTYKASPSNTNQQAQLAGPEGIYADQYGNEFNIEGRVIHGLKHFDDLRIEPNQNLVLIQKGKEFPAIYNESEIVWADGDVWKKPTKPKAAAAAPVNRRMPNTRRQRPNFDGDYQDQFGNRFAIDNQVVSGIDDCEGIDASEGGTTVFLQQSGKRYRGKFDPSFGINWQDGDIWERDHPPGAGAAVEMAARNTTKNATLTDKHYAAGDRVMVYQPEIQSWVEGIVLDRIEKDMYSIQPVNGPDDIYDHSQIRSSSPNMSQTPAFIDLLQGTFTDQHGNEFVVDGTKIFGLDGFERMSANPRGLVIVQSGEEYRATYDLNHIQWEDGDIWTKKTTSTNVMPTSTGADVSGVFIDQYNNVFRIRDMQIEGLDGFEGLSATMDGRMKMQQKGAMYDANFNDEEIIWDDQDVWKKAQPSISGFSAGEYRLDHPAAVTASFKKDSPVEMEIDEGKIVMIEIIAMVNDRVRGKIAESGWISMHSPNDDYTWVQPLSGGAPVSRDTAGKVDEVVSRDPQTQSRRPEMYSGDQKQSGVWGIDDGSGVRTESHADFKFTPDAFRFTLRTYSTQDLEIMRAEIEWELQKRGSPTQDFSQSLDVFI